MVIVGDYTYCAEHSVWDRIVGSLCYTPDTDVVCPLYFNEKIFFSAHLLAMYIVAGEVSVTGNLVSDASHGRKNPTSQLDQLSFLSQLV